MGRGGEAGAQQCAPTNGGTAGKPRSHEGHEGERPAGMREDDNGKAIRRWTQMDADGFGSRLPEHASTGKTCGRGRREEGGDMVAGVGRFP